MRERERAELIKFKIPCVLKSGNQLCKQHPYYVTRKPLYNDISIYREQYLIRNTDISEAGFQFRKCSTILLPGNPFRISY